MLDGKNFAKRLSDPMVITQFQFRPTSRARVFTSMRTTSIGLYSAVAEGPSMHSLPPPRACVCVVFNDALQPLRVQVNAQDIITYVLSVMAGSPANRSFVCFQSIGSNGWRTLFASVNSQTSAQSPV